MLEISVSLRVFTEGLRLEQVSLMFNREAQIGYSEGDKLSPKSTSTYDTTMWGIKSELSRSEDLNEHLDSLLAWLEDNKSSFMEISGRTQVKSDIFCGLFSENGQGGAQISSSVIKKLAEFDIDIVFEVYT